MRAAAQSAQAGRLHQRAGTGTESMCAAAKAATFNACISGGFPCYLNRLLKQVPSDRSAHSVAYRVRGGQLIPRTFIKRAQTICAKFLAIKHRHVYKLCVRITRWRVRGLGVLPREKGREL